MVKPLLHFRFLGLMLVLTVFCSCCSWATAAQTSPSPTATPGLRKQDIILFQAKIAPECANKCTVLVAEEPTPTGRAGAQALEQEAPPLQAPLRPWNTLTVAVSEDRSQYKAKITCSNKCQATTGRAFFIPTSSSKNTTSSTLTVHTSQAHSSTAANLTSTRAVYFLSNLKEKKYTEKGTLEAQQLLSVIVTHAPSSRAVCRARKGNSASVLKITSLLVWVAGCPLAAYLVSNFILTH